MASDSGSDLLHLSSISIEPVAQKKGLIVRHVEYCVTSERLGTEAVRRYSDFQALQELLLVRFPYRLVPRLPPAKLMANVVSVSSSFIGDRTNALVRWLTIVTSHPVIGSDPMVKFFMTDTLTDHATSLREQFKNFPDEFIMNEMGAQARELATPGLRSSVTAAQGQLAGLEEVLKRVAVTTERLVARSAEEERDMAEFAKDLGTIGSSASVFGDTDFFMESSKEVARVATKLGELSSGQEAEVHQKVLLLVDVLQAQAQLFPRLEKGLAKDHKIGVERIAMVKNRDIKGALATDHALRELLEKRVGDHEVVLSDLESRQAFALLCVESESKLALLFVSLLANLLNTLAKVQAGGMDGISEVWKALPSPK